jgi:hypothetical protein
MKFDPGERLEQGLIVANFVPKHEYTPSYLRVFFLSVFILFGLLCISNVTAMSVRPK